MSNLLESLTFRSLMSRLLLATLTVGLFLAIETHTSRARICEERPSAEEALAENFRVFSGKVVETYDLDIPEGYSYISFEERVIIYELQVSRVWKGPPNETAYVSAQGVGIDGQVLLDEGPEYIIYGNLYSCGRLAVIRGSHEDLAVLGPGHAPQAGTSEAEPSIIQQVEAIHGRIARTRLVVVAVIIASISAVVASMVGGRRFLRRRRALTIARIQRHSRIRTQDRDSCKPRVVPRSSCTWTFTAINYGSRSKLVTLRQVRRAVPRRSQGPILAQVPGEVPKPSRPKGPH